jgi:tetratricopeptide (TPR) repeat protein
MGLAYAMTARHQMAIPFFERALKLSENEKDKAVIWNHLGNVYRKLNNYEQALDAFRHADQLENTETSNSEQPPKVENEEEIPDIANAQEEDITASKTDDDPAAVMEEDSSPDETEGFIDNVDLEAEQDIDNEDIESENQLAVSSSDDVDITFKDEYETWEESQDQDEDDNKPVILEMDFTEKSFEEVSKKEGLEEQAVTNLSSVAEDTDEPAILELQREKHETGEVFSDEKPVEELLTASDSEELPASKESPQENLETEEKSFNGESGSETFSASDEEETPVAVDTGQKEDEIDETVPVKETVSELRNALEVDGFPTSTNIQEASDIAEPFNAEEESVDGGIKSQFLEQTQEIEDDEKSIESKLEIDNTVTHSFYDAYLREENRSFDENAVENQLEEDHTMAPVKVELTKTEMYMDDESTDTDQNVDMDTKNAHVWNELGNVYFTAGSFDDAIAAYSKAIELDTQFAWPYTNLASTYVKKERFQEAILLYQRSIELFSNENDKAVTWNRMGDVYRRLDDYENAIAAYQRADDLDPGNTAITNQTKFSLLGSEKIKQEVSYSL